MSTDRNRQWDEGEREALAGLESQIETMRERHLAGPSLELLHAARHDVLPGELQARLNAHLDASPWSRTLADGVADAALVESGDDPLDAVTEARILARVTRDTRGATPASPRRWLHPLPLWIGAAAAASLLIALGVQLARVSSPPAPVQTPTVAQRETPTAPAPSPNPEPAATVAQAAPFVLPFEKPSVRLSATALVWRGPGDGATSNARYLTDLKPGLDAYRASDYATAGAALGALRSRYPGAVEPLFYQGASRLLAGDPAGAIEPLSEAARVADDTFASDVTLLLAAAEQRTGRTDAARTRLRQGCAAADPRTARVCAARQQLDAALNAERAPR